MSAIYSVEKKEEDVSYKSTHDKQDRRE